MNINYFTCLTQITSISFLTKTREVIYFIYTGPTIFTGNIGTVINI